MTTRARSKLTDRCNRRARRVINQSLASQVSRETSRRLDSTRAFGDTVWFERATEVSTVRRRKFFTRIEKI
jgi:hypothetical protein